MTVMPAMHGVLYLIKDVKRLGHPRKCSPQAETQICSRFSLSQRFSTEGHSFLRLGGWGVEQHMFGKFSHAHVWSMRHDPQGSVQPDQSGPVNAQRNVPAAVQPDLAKTNSLGLGKADPRRFGRLQPKLQPDPPERKPAVDPRCPVGPHVDPQGKSDSSQTDMPATGQPDPLHRVSPVTNLQAARNAVKQTRQPWLQDLQEKLSAMQAVASRLPRPKVRFLPLLRAVH